MLVWNLATRALTATLPQPQPVTSVTWDGAGQLAAGDADGTARCGRCPPRAAHRQRDLGVAYSPDGKTLAVGGQTCSCGTRPATT